MAYLFASYFFLAIVLYVPGALFLRSLSFDRFLSIGLAPIVSCFAIIVIGIVFRWCGIFADWGLILLPFAALSVIAFLLRLYVDSKHGARGNLSHVVSGNIPLGFNLGINGGQLLVSLLVNAVIGAGVFLLALDGPESFSQGFDTGHHLSHVYATVQYGNFSTLNVALYGTGSGVFYPSLLHLIAALPVSLLGVSSSLALNAEILLLITLVYPIGVFLLGHQILGSNRYSGACSTALSLCFAGFPWILLRFCPLLANFCTMSFLPLLLVSFIYLFDLEATLRQRFLLASLMLAGVVVVAVAHPNGVFSAIVFLFPYCIDRILRECNLRFSASNRRLHAKVAGVSAFSLLTVFVWLFLFSHPAFHGVVTFDYSPRCGVFTAVLGIILQEMRHFAPNLPLAALVVIGIVAAIRNKGLRWLLFPYAISSVMLIACSCLPSCQLKFLLCGFWYNHDFRLMAVFGICSLPLAALGLVRVIAVLEAKLTALGLKRAAFAKQGVFQLSICSVLVTGVCVILICFPGFLWVDGKLHALPMAQACKKLQEVNDWNGERTALHSEERAFVQKALEVLPQDALVLNMPYDGSGFAYGLEGINVYYRTNSCGGRMGDNETLAVLSLNNAADDVEVADALRKMNVVYVLQLDQGLGEESSTLTKEYSADDWRGFVDLNDESKGFEIVLSEGDMRLYKITCLGN